MCSPLVLLRWHTPLPVPFRQIYPHLVPTSPLLPSLPSASLQGIYAAITMVSALVLSLRALCLTLGCLAAARTLHSRLLSRVLRLPLSFFDSQPSGRLLNRFTRDVEQMDLSLSGVIFSFLGCAFQVRRGRCVESVALTPLTRGMS